MTRIVYVLYDRVTATRKQPNVWTPQQAADWAEIKYRLLLDLLAQGLLPAIRVGHTHNQEMPDGSKRRRRAAKWIIPREAFQSAWRNFNPSVRDEEPRQ